MKAASKTTEICSANNTPALGELVRGGGSNLGEQASGGAPRSMQKRETGLGPTQKGRGEAELAPLKGYYFSENSDKKRNSHQCWEMRGKFIFLRVRL